MNNPKAGTKAGIALQEVKLYPNFPSRTIARILCDKHPKLYDGVEDARKSVRYVRGACGKSKRSRAKAPRIHGTTSDGVYPLPDPIPDSNEGWKVVPVTFDRCLFLSDIHIPFHAKDELEAAIAHGKKLACDTVYLNGDIVDFYNVSTHDRDPLRRFRLRDEIEMTKAFLEHLRDTFPKAQIIYKEGNHEERLARQVWRICPEMAGVMNPDGTPCVELASLLDLSGFGISHIGNKQPALFGEHLHALHGHEFRFPLTRSVNPARGLFQRTLCNSICGDMHQTSSHTEPSLQNAISTWSVGCLCNLRPAYMPINRWNHGFAVIHHNKGDWYVENHKIIRKKVV